MLLATAFFLIVCLCRSLEGINGRLQPEFYLLLAITTLAMMLLVSSVELITIYVSLELSSYPLYILTALRKGFSNAEESGIKYFITGAVSSAFMLFGMAMLYGATGQTHIAELAALFSSGSPSAMALMGLLFTMSGFFFKLALFPFHFWAPAAYQGAAHQVAGFIATATKVTAVALVLRLAVLGAKNPELIHALMVLSVASMTLGNLSAIVQKDLKRLLAYSAVAHAGYLLIGVVSMSAEGVSAAIFYATAYLLMNYLCFLVVVNVAADGKNISIDALAGLHRRSPMLAMAMLVGMFSLGGIPPTIGFTGKFLIFAAAMKKGYFFLVLLGMINVLISLYYYIKVIKAAYFLPDDQDMPPIRTSLYAKVLIAGIVAIIIVGGLYPNLLHTISTAAAGTMG